ncbi:MAG TPA: hypothetical protein VK469_16890 [Candidatus Kapabacteria bacterium]|nr:hypothetical protein [Candidatus Kapabacteria bacterium]
MKEKGGGQKAPKTNHAEAEVSGAIAKLPVRWQKFVLLKQKEKRC